MKKGYIFLLTLMMTIFTGLNAYADMTINVNKGGVVSLGGRTLEEGDNVFNGYDWCASPLICPLTHTMTVTTDNGLKPDVSKYGDDEYQCNLNPGTVPGANKIFVEVTEAGGGGGGDDPEPEPDYVYVVFTPDNCVDAGYVVLTDYFTYQETTYNVENGQIAVPFDNVSSFKIIPNTGYSFINCINEADLTNPHSSPSTPALDGTFTYTCGGLISANDVLIVTCSKAGSFTVKGIGTNVDNIIMENQNNYSQLTISESPTQFQCGGEEYKIYNRPYTAPLWKVEVTHAGDDEPELLEDEFYNFYYTPQDGDEVAIYTDRPETYAHATISVTGEDVTDAIIETVSYGNSEVAKNTWSQEDGWTMIAGNELKIVFKTTGYVNISCTVNGVPQTIGTNYSTQAKQVVFSITNDDPAKSKDYEIVISARKEQKYTATIICEHPEGLTVKAGSTDLNFSTSGQQFTISETNNILQFTPKSGWTVDGILVDGEVPQADDFVYNQYHVVKDCAITVNLTNIEELRTKTAVVYVDESVENPAYVSFKYADQTEVTIRPGYNFVKFYDNDLPFSLGYYGGGDAAYFVNGEKVTMVSPANETLDFEDGGIIKMFNKEPNVNLLTYELDDEIKDIIEIYHDHTTKVDCASASEFLCFPGTIVHIKPIAAAPAQVRTRSAVGAPLQVTVNDEKLEADDNGVYSFKVADKPISIKVAKDTSTGVVDIDAIDSESFTIYNLQGVAVKKNANKDDLRNIAAGIYVAGGKKVIVK